MIMVDVEIIAVDVFMEDGGECGEKYGKEGEEMSDVAQSNSTKHTLFTFFQSRSYTTTKMTTLAPPYSYNLLLHKHKD